MTIFIRAAALAATLIAPLSAHAALAIGDISGGGSFSGSVTRSDAWSTSNPIDGMEANFWTLSANAGDSISVTVNSSAIEFGMSLYQGMVSEFDLFSPGFDNAGDFASNVFVAGTPTFPTIGTELLNIVLPNTAAYTLVVGGEDFAFDNSFAYDMDVSVTPVPLPAAAWLLAAGLITLGALRRRS